MRGDGAETETETGAGTGAGAGAGAGTGTETGPETDEPSLACVLLAALPLQILAQRQPDLRELPAVVLTEDRPQGLILWTNRKARAAGVLPGMRYATALAMEPALRGGVVAQEAVQAALDEVGGLLRQFSPRLEPEPLEPGVFWLDTAGLTGLFGSLQDWASQLHHHLLAAHWHATVAVGWRRFALYAIARHRRGVQVCTDTAEEQRWRDRVPLASLGQVFALPPAVRDAVAKLGVKTLGDYLALPALQLQERYGTEARASHKLASDAVVQPLRPQLPQPPPHACRDLEPADDNRERLLFVLRGLLGGLLREVAVRRQSVAGLLLTLHLEVPRQDLARDSSGEALARPVLARLLHEVLQPAEPTLQEAQLTDLLRLRLEQLVLVAGVERLELTLQTVPASADQLRLWQLAGKRNLDAATAALARVRAAFGPQAVLQAVLRPEHLPHARFGWLPREAVLPALPLASVEEPVLVRRLLAVPQLLPGSPPLTVSAGPLGYAVPGRGRVAQVWGPVCWSGQWWTGGGDRKSVQDDREDFFVRTERGDLLWLYRDTARNQWFLQGELD
jgi:protein ImuB